MLKPTVRAKADAAAEFLILCKPISGIFNCLNILIFLFGNLIFKSYLEYSLNCFTFLMQKLDLSSMP